VVIMRVAALFPAQGLQYPGMGQSLAAGGDAVAEMAARIRGTLLASGYPSDPIADMRGEVVDDPLRAQTLVYTHSVLAWAAFRAAVEQHGLAVDVVVAMGHSVGETAALVAAGTIDAETMARIVHVRARLMYEAPCGGLVNVELPREDVVRWMDGFHAETPGVRVHVALSQGAALTAVGGVAEAIEGFARFLAARGVPHRWVVGVSKPLHTPEQHEIGARFRAELARFRFDEPCTLALSSTTAMPYRAADAADLLAAQLDREARFAAAVRRVQALRPDRYLLFGPADKLAELLIAYNGVDARSIRIVNTRTDVDELTAELRALAARRPLSWLHGDRVGTVRAAYQ
jgi:[acyl-carrier-protein] S-malonyltransferase